MRENSGKMAFRKSETECLPEPDHAGILILDFQPQELWGMNFCCLCPKSGIFATVAWTKPQMEEEKRT